MIIYMISNQYNSQKQMDSDYTHRSRSEVKLTLSQIGKILRRWMNKQDKKDIEEESHFMITDALELVFQEIKDTIPISRENGSNFEEVMRMYIDLIQCTGNNKYRFVVENHIKELLKGDSYDKFKLNPTYYQFFFQVFDYFPFLVFRFLQSKYKLIFQESLEEVIKLYGTYIKFANTRKNDKLIDQYIQEEVNSPHGSIDKLDILLLTFSNTNAKVIKEYPLQQIIKLITDYNKEEEKSEEGWEMSETKVQKFCETFFKIRWPYPLESYKSRIALSVIKKWESYDEGAAPPKKCINTIVNSIELDEYITVQLEEYIKDKIGEHSSDTESYALNCEFVRILLSKFTREQAERIFDRKKYMEIVEEICHIEDQEWELQREDIFFNCEEKIKLLEVIRVKEIYHLQNEIETQLYGMIMNRFYQKPYMGEVNPDKTKSRTDNLVFSLKAIRLYKFKNFDKVYNNFKKLILRDSKLMKQCSKELRLQILQVCLHYCKNNDFGEENKSEERAAFRDIIEFIGQEIDLKIAMIEYIVEHLHERFFNQNEIYTIYRQSKYEFLLFQDFATNDIIIKIFSIKTICYLAENSNTDYRLFLKNAYNVIYDRLGIKGLLSANEIRTSLQIIREIIRYRGEMFEKESEDLAALLISELHQSIEFHSPQMNSVSGYILKIFQALMIKLPNKMMRYIPCLAQYLINILNFKIIKKELKNLAVETFCEMAESCHYVILPYFHFPHLYEIIRQILLSDDHYYYYQNQLFRLIGRLGYIGQEEFIGLRVLNQRNHQVQQNFQTIFKETYFLKEYRNQINLHASALKYKKMIIQDCFYNQEKMSKNTIEIDKYLDFILVTLTNNVSLSIAEATLSKSLKTIQNLIPVLTEAKDQKMLHNLLFHRLFQIEEKYHNDVLSILFLLLSYHNIEQHSNSILKHYIRKAYNHKREDEIIKLICLMTDNNTRIMGTEIVDLIIVVKKIITDSVELGHQQDDKIKSCFNIIINIGPRVDRVLHLFFGDINKLFCFPQEKSQQKSFRPTKEDISQSILSSYITFILQLSEKCPSLQYFLPSIRQFLILYFNREIGLLQARERSRKKNTLHTESCSKFLKKVIDAMICLMIKYGKQCESFINLLSTNIKNSNINHKLYNISESYFKKHSNLDYMLSAFNHQDLKKLWNNNDKKSNQLLRSADSRSNYEPRDPRKIMKEFENFCLEHNHTGEQDELWMDNLSYELLNSSNEDTLRACAELASYDKVFGYNLFEVPFYFYWKSLYKNIEEPIYLYEDFQHLTEVKPLYVPSEDVVKLTLKIKTILVRKDISLKIRQKFLDCIYFIERCEMAIMIKDKILYDVAVEVEDSVKALFYLEREYEYDPDVYRESLIEKYAEMGEKESAIGLFRIIKLSESGNKENTLKLSQKLGPTVQFLEELNSRREKQKAQGNRRDKGQLNIIDLELKRDICDWESIYKMIEKENPKHSSGKSKFAHFAIEASINLGQWDNAKSWTPFLEEEKKTEEVKVWLTMLKINEQKYEQAEKMIYAIRDDMNYKIRQMFSLSFEKSMKGVLILQQASELEEIVIFHRTNETLKKQRKLNQFQADNRKKLLIQLWKDRLEGFKSNLYSMQQIMTVRSLLLSKKEDFDNWIQFCKLALKENQKYLARLTYKQLQSLVITNKTQKLELLLISLQIQILEQVSTNDEAFTTIQEKISSDKLIEDKNTLPLIFQIYQKYSQRAIQQEKFTVERGGKFIKILKSFPALKDYYELYHYMGLLNIKLLQTINDEEKKRSKHERKLTINLVQDDFELNKTKLEQSDEKSVLEKKSQYMLSALKCFIKSVTFNQRENKFFLEDCLKILNLMSMGNNTARLIDELRLNYVNIPKEGLIEIIPQLIARLDNESPTYKEMMKDVIIYIGRDHPQTLLFPLIYMKKGYKSESKKELAVQIIDKISQSEGSQGKISQLFKEAQEIVEEICKISLKLSEKVNIFMKKIIKMVEDGKVSRNALAGKMIEFCQNILSENEKLSSTSQFGFIQEERSALILVIQNLELYRQLEEESFFDQAINLIRQIKQRTKQTLRSIREIYLQEASNKLFKIHKSDIILFGTYTPLIRNVRIDSFKNEIKIIPSKQRPKKIIVVGSDQKEYNYLVKGKEDLRLDERIMQLFTFINKMFHSPSDKESYSIQGYSITPISYEIGIISWVENCDTMGELIQSYRFANGVRVQHGKIESKLCRHIYPKYPDIQKYHKVQIYHEIIKQVSGMDLRNIFCRRSQTSEKWLKNRSCFIRSLGVMSIVGYIIGLGDRHPFNIMIQRDTWKVVHIDFGDCFEVNKMRKIYPEKVPFRLTRMLVNAMEACKTDGIFKHTCEKIMKILRMNKESILVIVEAFRYDPLFGWKITSRGEKEDEVRLEHMEWGGIEAIMLDGEEEKEETYVYLEREGVESTRHILKIIKNKLIGKEKDNDQHGMTEAKHVDLLIKEAMSPLNLVQHFQNWCIFW